MFTHTLSPENAASTVAPVVLTVNVTDSATFTCSAAGVPYPSIVWTLPDGSEIIAIDQQSEIRPRIYAENVPSNDTLYAVTTLLTINDASRDDEGVYTCIAENDDSITSSTATLTVQGKLLNSITLIIAKVTSMHSYHYKITCYIPFPLQCHQLRWQTLNNYCVLNRRISQ